MRIGIDCRMYGSGFTGIGKYTKMLVSHLMEIDTKNEYLLYFNSSDFNAFRSKAPNFTKILVNTPHYSLSEQLKFGLILYQTKPDLMHFTHFNAPICYIKKQITTIHDLTLHYYKGEKYRNPLSRLAYKTVFGATIRKSSHIIVPTKFTALDLKKLYPSTQNKISIIGEGVDDIFINSPTPKSDIFTYNYILYTGNWREHKNLWNLFSAFEILVNHYGYQGKLVLTGNIKSGSKQLQERAKTLIKKGLIVSLGLIDIDKMPNLYQGADCYVFPSLYEGFGLPILEAFASKTPVVASRESCLQEVSLNGAIYFNPLDPQDMAIKIISVLTNNKLKTKLIKAGTERLQHFSFRKMAQETLKTYLST